jgi:hypothetical protein
MICQMTCQGFEGSRICVNQDIRYRTLYLYTNSLRYFQLGAKPFATTAKDAITYFISLKADALPFLHHLDPLTDGGKHSLSRLILASRSPHEVLQHGGNSID